MSTTSQLAQTLHEVFENHDRGVVGLVDDLLRLCAEEELQLDWRAGRCVLRSMSNGTEEAFEPLLPKSAFRAVLARVAAVCNQRVLDCVSPYGGHCELPGNHECASTLLVTFTNTTDQQVLQVVPAGRVSNPSGR